MFSILIPTWNNLPYLQQCIESIQRNSSYDHQILIHLNDGSDGSLVWAQQQSFTFEHSVDNIGICSALHGLSKHIEHEFVCYMNDDMYCLPKWDEYLIRDINSFGEKDFMISATLIEPNNTGNPCVLIADYGKNIQEFNAKLLEQQFDKLGMQNWSGSFWPPNVVRRSSWNKLSGFDELFSPGFGSDDDFAYRMWLNGCRIFKGNAQSRVYHFGKVSTSKISSSQHTRLFFQKHKQSATLFRKYYLQLGRPFQGELTEPKKNLSYYLRWLKYYIKYGL